MATQEYPTNGIDRCAYYHADLATAMANVPESANIVGRDWLPSKYGVDDQIGAANLITSQKVLDALCSGWSGSTFIWLTNAGRLVEGGESHLHRPQVLPAGVINSGSHSTRCRPILRHCSVGGGVKINSWRKWGYTDRASRAPRRLSALQLPPSPSSV
jgi:hypothetical protein